MSQVRTGDNRPAHQLSPLLLGPTILPKQFTPPKATQLGLIAAVLFVISLLVIWFLLWRAGIQDRRRARQLFTKNLPPDASFESLREG